jgi:hypothetical protein
MTSPWTISGAERAAKGIARKIGRLHAGKYPRWHETPFDYLVAKERQWKELMVVNARNDDTASGHS